MSQHNVLMLAFLFPPTAAVGGHRTLRFATYLPEYDWNPLVIAAKTEDSGYACDDALGGKVPPKLSVVRTQVPNIEEFLFGRLRRVFTGRRGGTNEDRGSPTSKVFSTDRGSRAVQVLRSLRDRVFFSPDSSIAWSGPAIRASMRFVRTTTVDVLYSTSPPHSTHLIALRLKRLTGLPWVADFRDPWAAEPWAQSNRTRSQQRLAERLENRCVTSADRVILNTPRMQELFLRLYPEQPRDKFLVIPNGIDPKQLAAIRALRDGCPAPPNECVVICHPGSLYQCRNPIPFFQAMKKLADEGIPVAFEQYGPVESHFGAEQFVAAHGLNNRVSFRGTVDHSTVLRAMARADVLLLVKPGTSIQVPAKLYEMIPFEKPVLALADRGATADLVERYRLGVVVDPHDVDAICAAIKRLREHPAEFVRDRRVAIEAFDGRALTGKFAKVLDSCRVLNKTQ